MKRLSEEQHQGNCFNAVSRIICENLDINDLYRDFHVTHNDEDGLTSHPHKALCISQIVNTYMTLKSKIIGKKITDDERGELLRHRRKRSYILAGQ